MQDDVLRGLLFTDGKIGVFGQCTRSLADPESVLPLPRHRPGDRGVARAGGRDAHAGGRARSGARRDGHARIETNSPVLAVHDRQVVTMRWSSRTMGTNRRWMPKRVLINAGPRTFARLLGPAVCPDCHRRGVGGEGEHAAAPPAAPAGAGRLAGRCVCRFVPRGRGVCGDGGNVRRGGGGPPARQRPPFETYCHTLTDDSILSPALRADGYQTLTLFGLDAPLPAVREGRRGAQGGDAATLPRGHQSDYGGAVRGLPGARQARAGSASRSSRRRTWRRRSTSTTGTSSTTR